MSDRSLAEDLRERHQRAKDLYWNAKDVEGASELLRSGIADGTAGALDATAEGVRLDLLGQVKAMNYNLASFLWEGWGVEGFKPTASHVAIGKQAAAENLRYAIELERPAAALAGAHFLLGAYQLSERDHQGAKHSFSEFGRLAQVAEDALLGTLAHGYLLMTDALTGVSDATTRLETLIADERAYEAEDHTFVADQLATAARVFGLTVL